jgi:hypothetical protein
MTDRTYYFQVVSRDPAGNVTIDDNQGRLYTVRTLKPLVAPYLENFDGPLKDWTTASGGLEDEDASFPSDAVWQLGVPRNGMETEAFSPPNAWGSNLEGGFVEFADTDLISPAIELTGGNRAFLRFWHSYDFTEKTELLDLEAGGLLISTNNGDAWTILRQYGDWSFGWEDEEIDLTAYLGRVIRLRWNYGVFAFDAAPRPGWLVDDVAVVVTNVLRGTLQVSNNLSQAVFTLSGPLTQTGQGVAFSVPSAPVGEYTITYQDVPFYIKPRPETRNLAANATVVFQGQYTFPDVNNNGMSDLWEMHYFGEVSPLRTRGTDSDGDGVSDFAEFVAGTDPTQAVSRLALASIQLLPNGTLRLNWGATAGHVYRVMGSNDAATWIPYSGWIRAASAQGTFTIPALNPGTPHFFLLEVRP